MPTTFFLLFGLMSLGFAAFTYFMFDYFILSNYRNAKRCTERTEGVIIRYSYALFITELVSQWLSTLLMGTDTRF